jgi:protein SCO1/2
MPRTGAPRKLVHVALRDSNVELEWVPVRVLPTLVLCLALAAPACSRSRQYELRGQVVAVDAANAKITIKHEDIRGFMPAMTMPFDVRDRKLLDGREAGELIAATLVVEENGAYLSAIRRTGMAPLAEAPVPAPSDVQQVGDRAPDAAFLDQQGRARRFSDWRGQVVAVTFIYTRCPLPNFCPLMDRHFREVQRAIADDPALRGRAHLVTISFDPAYDTPTVLASHAARISADPEHWTLLTGAADQVERFTAKFGVSVIKGDQAGAEIVHNLRTAVIDADGRIVTILSGSDWTPVELIGHLRGALR